MPQIMGSGAALLDFDRDGLLDVFVVDGGDPTGSGRTGLAAGRLYRQSSMLRFVDVTRHSEFNPVGIGMGAAVGDIDNDGDLDLYITGFGPDRLFENKGDGTFLEATESSGIDSPRWSSAASFLDYDRDGHLDLFVVNYLDYSPGSACHDAAGRPDYCGPQSFAGVADRLFRNEGRQGPTGGALFRDMTVSSGIVRLRGKGLGVYCRDFTGDGLPDIYVANDMEPNFLWVQQPNGTFHEEAALRGAATNQLGEAEASMGVVAGDLNEDGHFDLLLTHLSGETNTFYSGQPEGYFEDRTARSGLGPPSLSNTGFGVVTIDLEHDGDLDLVVVNGRVRRDALSPPVDAGHWSAYAQRNQIFLNDARGRFSELSGTSELFCREAAVARGLASGDLDNDGDIDLLVTNVGGRARFWLNQAPKAGDWLSARLIDCHGNRDAWGAEVVLHAGGRRFVRDINPSSSYLVSNDPRAHFGTQRVGRFDQIVVHWPDAAGTREAFPGGAMNRHIVLVKGTGARSARESLR